MTPVHRCAAVLTLVIGTMALACSGADTTGPNSQGTATGAGGGSSGGGGGTTGGGGGGSSGLNGTAVGVGTDHSCAIATSGTLYCWGGNSYGQLGNGSISSSDVPVAVTGATRFASLAVHGRDTCALTTAGAAYCWGEGDYGQLGNGSDHDVAAPVPVLGGLTFASLAVGFEHVCGVASGGKSYCWGAAGAPGLGSTAPRLCFAGALSCVTTPTLLPSVVFSAITAGLNDTCGLTAGGAAYCWGRNDDGQLGIGTIEDDHDAPVAVAGHIVFQSINGGFLHTCGVSVDGAAYCWGRDEYGQLGTASTPSTTCEESFTSFPCASTPSAVAGGHAFAQVSGGENFTCGITTAGAAYCWGNNSSGQLGDGTTKDATTPVAVAGNLTFRSVSAGGVHACAVTTDNRIYCWGDNENGELGAATTDICEAVSDSGIIPVRCSKTPIAVSKA